MNITITLQADSKLLAAIELIANTINVKPVAESKGPSKMTVVNTPKTAPQKAEVFPDNLDNETFDIAKVRAIAAEASQAGKKEQIKGILKEMNVARVTDLAENQFSEFVQKVKAI